MKLQLHKINHKNSFLLKGNRGFTWLPLFFVFILFLLGGAISFADTKLNEKEEVNASIQQLVDISKKLSEKGIESLTQKRILEAIKSFRLAINLAPYHPEPYAMMAKMFLRLKNDESFWMILEEATRRHTNIDIILKSLDWRSEFLEKQILPQDLQKVSIAPFKGNKKCAISFNFDDGPRSVYTKALPLFEAVGFRATIAINPEVVHETTQNPWWGSWQEWRDAHKRGFEIANHGFRHRKLNETPIDELDKEINGSYDLIKNNIGIPPFSFMFPHDAVNVRVIAKANERHVALRYRGSLKVVYKNIFNPVYGGQFFSSETARQMVDMAIAKRLWFIPECHAIESIGVKTYKPITEDFLRTHLAYIKSREDDIWVDTFKNVYTYLIEKKMTHIQIGENTDTHVSFVLVNPLNKQRFNFPLTIIINTAPLQVRKAAAVQKGPMEARDVIIGDQKLYIEGIIPQGTRPVFVTWE